MVRSVSPSLTEEPPGNGHKGLPAIGVSVGELLRTLSLNPPHIDSEAT